MLAVAGCCTVFCLSMLRHRGIQCARTDQVTTSAPLCVCLCAVSVCLLPASLPRDSLVRSQPLRAASTASAALSQLAASTCHPPHHVPQPLAALGRQQQAANRHQGVFRGVGGEGRDKCVVDRVRCGSQDGCCQVVLSAQTVGLARECDLQQRPTWLCV